MKINKVELKNYRIHKDYALSFEKGINLLLGSNGSGKSSVLEAIGFALFDSGARGNNEDIVSKGETSGSVKILFTGNDEKEYEIERKFGAGSYVKLVNLESLDKWTGSKDVYRIVGKILNIDNINGVFFESVICAKQNKFIDIFIKGDKKQADHFDELFDTAIYSDLCEKLREQNEKKYEDENKIKIAKKETLASQQKNIADLEGELKKQHEELASEKEKQANLENELKGKKKELDEYNNLKERINSKEKEVKNSKSNIENFTKARNDAVRYLKDSEAARAFLEEKKDDYEKYESAKKESDALEKELLQFKNAAKEYKELQNQQQKLKDDQNKLQSDKKIEENNINSFTEQISKQETEQKEEQKKLKEIESNKEAKRIELENIKKQVETLHPIINELEKLANSKEDKAKEEKRLKKTEAELTSGICPTLKISCPKIANKDFFENQFKELTKEKNEIEEKIKELSQKAGFASIDEIKSSMKSSETLLIKQQQEIKNFDTHINDCNKKFKKINDEISVLLKKKESSLNNVNKIVETASEKIVELQKLEPKIKKAEEDKINAEKLQSEINKIKNETLSKLEETYKKCLLHQKTANEYEMRKNHLETSEKSILNETEKMNKFSDELNKLKASFSEEDLKLKTEAFDNLTNANKSVLQKAAGLQKDIEQKAKEIEECKKTENEIRKLNSEIAIIRQKLELTKIFREKIKGLGRIVAEERVRSIASVASDYYNRITNKEKTISWVCSEDDKYSLYLKNDEDLKDDEKKKSGFANLCGGEQISVAIAVRLALSQEFGNSGLIILDEPTNNLDENKRQLLAENLPKMVENLTQLFVVTHDNTFRDFATKVIEFTP